MASNKTFATPVLHALTHTEQVPLPISLQYFPLPARCCTWWEWMRWVPLCIKPEQKWTIL